MERNKILAVDPLTGERSVLLDHNAFQPVGAVIDEPRNRMIVARYQSLGIDEVSLNDGMATHMISPASWLEGKIAYEDMANRLFYIENRHIGAVDLSSGDDVRWLY